MKALNQKECRDWLNKSGFTFEEGVPPISSIVELRQHHFNGAFVIPDGARPQLYIARTLSRLFSRGRTLVWMSNWGSREEDVTVCKVFRRSLGEARWFNEAPGMLFLPEENEELADVIQMTTAFNWEGFVLNEDRQFSVWLADEVVEIDTTLPKVAFDVAELKTMFMMDEVFWWK